MKNYPLGRKLSLKQEHRMVRLVSNEGHSVKGVAQKFKVSRAQALKILHHHEVPFPLTRRTSVASQARALEPKLDYLRRLHLEEARSVTSIAKGLGTGYSVIALLFKTHNVPIIDMKTVGERGLTVRILELWDQGLSSRRVAREVGRSRAYALSVIARHRESTPRLAKAIRSLIRPGVLYHTVRFMAGVAQLEGPCEICGRTRRLCIDHCHTTGKVRGLLCNGCNTGIGQFRDQESLLKSAIRYLRKSQDFDSKSGAPRC